MLAEAQDEQDWLAEETTKVTITPDAITGLVRTRAVVNETLRLFPAAFTIVRETIKHDHTGDIDLPPRSVVMIAPWVLHRHQRLWDDPSAFQPTRFMPDQPPPPRFAFMPFGAGPRICVGAQFAMSEAILVLAAIIGRFRVTRVDTRPVLPVGIVTTQPDHPARVRLTLR
jgi:unspecific monooxygenase